MKLRRFAAMAAVFVLLAGFAATASAAGYWGQSWNNWNNYSWNYGNNYGSGSWYPQYGNYQGWQGYTPAPAPTTPPAPATGGDVFSAPMTALEQQMLGLVNQERTSRGLQPLQADAGLLKIARMKSADLIKNNYFAHNSPVYGSPFDMMKAAGISYKAAGENLAGDSSVQSAHSALMNSSGHRANILNPAYTWVGIGIVQGGPYGYMFSQEFIG